MEEVSIEEFIEICFMYNSGLTVTELKNITYRVSSFTKQNIELCLENSYERE